jgi:hypothetical protein
MARRTHTYAIRLAVEGGGQVKAELVSVGQSGEQRLKRIETAGDRASGGLKGLGRQAELLRTGIRTLGGALAGVATVGGLAALVDRSIPAANAIGKTADTIGVGVEALRELRFRCQGVWSGAADAGHGAAALHSPGGRGGAGHGEAKDALAQMSIALSDQSGNLRRSEDLLGDVADAFARIEIYQVLLYLTGPGLRRNVTDLGGNGARRSLSRQSAMNRTSHAFHNDDRDEPRRARREYLFLGGGAAGKLLAWELARAGRPTAVIECADRSLMPQLACQDARCHPCPPHDGRGPERVSSPAFPTR